MVNVTAVYYTQNRHIICTNQVSNEAYPIGVYAPQKGKHMPDAQNGILESLFPMFVTRMLIGKKSCLKWDMPQMGCIFISPSEGVYAQ